MKDHASQTRQRHRRVVVLGSTGSVGTNSLEVIEHFPDRLEVIGLSAHSSWKALFQQATRFRPRWIALSDPEAERQADLSLLPIGTELLTGPDAVARMSADSDTDIVVAAIVGSAGLAGTWEALSAGKTVALANKETLVMAGSRVTELAARRGGRILPVDSEHSAIFQALAGQPNSAIERLVLTGSGGPFRGKNRDELKSARLEDALKHPTWKMGPKITIDSATLMNKSLEVIEARWLFNLPPEQIDVIIHPESIVHSFVEFRDGSVLAQLSPPDMRLPIQYALNYPDRLSGPAKRLDWSSLRALHFEAVDRKAFDALDLGYQVARSGGTSGAVLNAANEAAVGLFLEGRLAFLDIARACRAVLAQHPFSPSPSIEELMAADRWARQEVSRWIRQTSPSP
ncbi:MAG: 1-deoxy-D-xylulose-5-phosphate reductoisomerase [Planctomycetes bacterium]|nr:1-deoxy-D-xylulose-5-phosphate reductoisomerase [Planctomycetota bacterium]